MHMQRERDGSLVCKLLSFVLPINVFNFSLSQSNLQNVKLDSHQESYKPGHIYCQMQRHILYISGYYWNISISQYIALKVIVGLVQSGLLRFVWAGTDVKTGGLHSCEPPAAVGIWGRQRGERRRWLSVDGLGSGFVEAKRWQNKNPFLCLNSNN